MKVTGKQRNSRMCFICGMDNPVGFHSQFYNMEDGSVMTPIRFGENHQSFPGRVHGGLIATMLDELGLRALWSGGDELYIPLLIGLGLDEFSMNSNSILKARKKISELEKFDCKELADEILKMTSAE